MSSNTNPRPGPCTPNLRPSVCFTSTKQKKKPGMIPQQCCVVPAFLCSKVQSLAHQGRAKHRILLTLNCSSCPSLEEFKHKQWKTAKKAWFADRQFVASCLFCKINYLESSISSKALYFSGTFLLPCFLPSSLPPFLISVFFPFLLCFLFLLFRTSDNQCNSCRGK